MKSLREYIKEAEAGSVAIGHFNVSDVTTLHAVTDAAQEVSKEAGRQIPVIIGVSEGERTAFGIRQIVAVIKSLQHEREYPVFLNADHTHSLQGVEDAVNAGFDAVIFDGAQHSLEENIAETQEAVQRALSLNPNVLVEGELGFIGTASEVLQEIPEGAAQGSNLTTPEEAALFVEKTGVHLLAPAVGNLHGMLSGIAEPHLDIPRIQEIRNSANVPLVLHGGSGTRDEDFVAAIRAGISIIHISTELRVAWRKGLEETFRKTPNEVAPYRLLKESGEDIKAIAIQRLKLFNNLV